MAEMLSVSSFLAFVECRMDSQENDGIIHDKTYHGLLPRADMTMLLRNNGDFLIRMSEPAKDKPRQYIISVMVDKNSVDIRHYIIHRTSHGFALGTKKSFKTIQQLIQYHALNNVPLFEAHPNSLLKTPIFRQKWELDHRDIECIKKLGEGAFGEVHKGLLRQGNEKIEVAIKMAKLEALSNEQVKDCLKEFRLMRMFDHPHVVKTYGVAAGMDPVLIVMELAQNGALDTYLKLNEVSVELKTEMCMQASFGIEYLHKKNIIHRDLAARNCLYGDGKVMISDFGLSRIGSVYRVDQGKRVPLKWLAPETLRIQIYTSKTDVFTYGVMCWEIYHNGKEPYPNMTPGEVVNQIQEGYRMSFESPAHPELQKLIVEKVWSDNPDDRPPMSEVCSFFERLLNVHRPEIKSTTFVPTSAYNAGMTFGNGGQTQNAHTSKSVAPTSALPAPVAATPNINQRTSIRAKKTSRKCPHSNESAMSRKDRKPRSAMQSVHGAGSRKKRTA